MIRKAHGFMLASLVLVSCGTFESKDRRLSKHLTEHMGFHQDSLPSLIAVVTEEGCPACDRSFADLVRKRTSVPQCLIVVRASGASIDLNGFLSETSQIRFDDDGTFRSLGLLNGSGLVVLHENRIMSVIELVPDELEPQLKRITYMLDSLDH